MWLCRCETIVSRKAHRVFSCGCADVKRLSAEWLTGSLSFGCADVKQILAEYLKRVLSFDCADVKRLLAECLTGSFGVVVQM